MKRALLILTLLVTAPPCVLAHEARPAYLELRQTGLETYDVLWKVPGQGDDLRLGLYVELPTECSKSLEGTSKNSVCVRSSSLVGSKRIVGALATNQSGVDAPSRESILLDSRYRSDGVLFFEVPSWRAAICCDKARNLS